MASGRCVGGPKLPAHLLQIRHIIGLQKRRTHPVASPNMIHSQTWLPTSMVKPLQMIQLALNGTWALLEMRVPVSVG